MDSFPFNDSWNEGGATLKLAIRNQRRDGRFADLDHVPKLIAYCHAIGARFVTLTNVPYEKASNLYGQTMDAGKLREICLVMRKEGIEPVSACAVWWGREILEQGVAAAAWSADMVRKFADVGIRNQLAAFPIGAEIVAEAGCGKVFEAIVRAYGPVVQAAESANICLAIHPFRNSPVDSTGEHLSRFLAALDSPANGVCICLGELAAAGEDPVEQIRHFTGRIHNVHLRNIDAQLQECRLDAGIVEIPAALHALAAAGYTGPLTLEHYPGQNAATDLEWQTANAAAHGYIRGMLDAMKSNSHESR